MDKNLKKSTQIAVCGLSTALSVALLFLGGAAFFLAYTIPMFAGFLLIAVKKTFGTSSAVITYVSTSLLSLMIVTDRECAIMYVFCFGCYPLVQDSLNKIKNAFLRVLLKFLFLNSLLAAGQLILVFVFAIPFLEEGEGRIFILIFALAMNLIFFLYDRILGRLLFLYSNILEKHIKRIFK